MRKSSFGFTRFFTNKRKVKKYGTSNAEQNGGRADEKAVLENGTADDRIYGPASARIRRKTARVGVFAVGPVYLPRRVFVHAVRKRACARVVDVPHSGDPHLRFLLPVFKTGGQENSGYGELR